MTFTEALNAIFHDGDRVQRTSWATPNVYCGLEGGKLSIWGAPADGLWHPWTVGEADYFAQDWEVVVDA